MKFTPRLTAYIAFLFIAILAMVGIRFFLKPQDKARDLREIRQEGILRISLEYSPTSFYVSGDSLEGFDYRLCKAIEKASNLKVEIYPEMNLQNSLEGLNQRRIDIVARQIPMTTQLKEEYNFSIPLQTNKQVLVQRSATDSIKPIRNQIELGGKTVYIPQDSPARLRLMNLSQEIADSIYWKEDSLYGEEQLIIKVAMNQIDYAICDASIAKLLQKQYPQIDINTDISFNQFRGWVLRKESQELLDSLNMWLEKDIFLHK